MQAIQAELIDAPLLTVNLGNLGAVVDLDRAWTTAELEGAVRGVIHVFPILSARYVRGWWRDRWLIERVDVSRIAKRVECDDFEVASTSAFSEAIDTEAGPPLRVTLITNGSRSRLVLNLPHHLCDGNGVLTVLRELSAQLMGSGQAEPVKASRSLFQLFSSVSLSRLPMLLSELLRENLRLLMVPFTGHWASGFKKSRTATTMHLRRIELDAESSARFAGRCKAEGATVNDGLMAVSYRAVRKRTENGRAGVAYTVNLRRYLREPRPIVANLSGFTSVSLSVGKGSSWGETVRRFAPMTGEHKRRLPGLASNLLPVVFFWWLNHGVLHAVGRRFKKLMVWQGSRFILMTNIGVMDPYVEPFGEHATDAWMFGPYVPAFPAPVTTGTTFRGRISLTVSATPEFDSDSVDAVADDCREALREAVADPRPLEA